MLAVYAARQSADDPLSGLEIGQRPDPQPREGWTTVTVTPGSAVPAWSRIVPVSVPAPTCACATPAGASHDIAAANTKAFHCLTRASTRERL